MERQARIFKNESDHEVFDPQLGVTIPPHGRVSVVTAYHMPPSKSEIVDITDMPEYHTPEAIAEHDELQGRQSEVPAPTQGDLKTELNPPQPDGGQADAQ